MLRIPYVQLELLLPADAVASVHLCPARKPRTHIVAMTLALVIPRQLLHEQRSRAYEGHLTCEYIYELR